jgi:hypothetical protein
MREYLAGRGAPVGPHPSPNAFLGKGRLRGRRPLPHERSLVLDGPQ